jgi:hypothetical protein
LDKVENLYKEFSTRVFAIGNNPQTDPSSWSRLVNYGNMIKSGAFYSTKHLEETLSTFCGTGNSFYNVLSKLERMIDVTMDSRVSSLKVFFVTTVTSVIPPKVNLMRNYEYPPSSRSRYQGECKTRICDALKASTAGITYTLWKLMLHKHHHIFQNMRKN